MRPRSTRRDASSPGGHCDNVYQQIEQYLEIVERTRDGMCTERERLAADAELRTNREVRALIRLLFEPPNQYTTALPSRDAALVGVQFS